jgi:hypothetical protein
MRRKYLLTAVSVLGVLCVYGWMSSSGYSGPANDTSTVNPAIDMSGFLTLSVKAAEHRASRRVSETDFIRMSREPNTIVLDARSKEKFDLLHVDGAINLSFPDLTIASLASTIPDKSTRVLIYCNNNFRNAEKAFPSKVPSASLNLSTYLTLYTYGYMNVYELAPQIDPAKAMLTLRPTAGAGSR